MHDGTAVVAFTISDRFVTPIGPMWLANLFCSVLFSFALVIPTVLHPRTLRLFS